VECEINIMLVLHHWRGSSNSPNSRVSPLWWNLLICVNVVRCRLHITSGIIAPNLNVRATSMR